MRVRPRRCITIANLERCGACDRGWSVSVCVVCGESHNVYNHRDGGGFDLHRCRPLKDRMSVTIERARANSSAGNGGTRNDYDDDDMMIMVQEP